MSIRVKLYISYMAMVFVPLIMMCTFILLILHAGGIEDARHYIEEKGKEPYLQAFVYGELSYVLRSDTDRLEQPDFVSDIQRRLGELWAGLLISRNGEITSVAPFLLEASPNEDWQQLLNAPPANVKFNSYQFETNVMEFTYSDGAEGRAVLLRRMDTVPIYWRPIGMIFSLAFIGITSILLTYFVSRSIIKPIKALEAAALQMKEGDLSHQVEVKARGEIGELSIALEEMRGRLKQSIDQSLQYEENRKMLLSHVSHDLKTPISAIKGYIEGMMDGIANTEEKRTRYMQTIYRKASDMDQLIDELFLFSKLDLQRVAFDFKLIDIRRYVDHFMEEQRFDLNKSEVSLTYVHADDSSIMVAADPDKLGRVLMNILENCVKYMGHQPESSCKEIIVSIEELERDALVVIEDTGPGIEEDALPHIFDRFFRAEQSRNSETGGSGLGLAIVKQIIEGHGGKVWAENAERGGARFYLKLPKASAAKTVSKDEEHTNH